LTFKKSDYDDLITKSAKKYKLDKNLIRAVIAAESSFRQNAVSHAGAQGLMQLMPQTAKRFKVTDSFDPAQNIDGGSQYLKFLIKLFDNDMDLVLAAYNAGEGAVQKYGGIPPYPETINYVKKVKAYYSSN
jgi:soluble lytic murein transglycosylase-like protein